MIRTYILWLAFWGIPTFTIAQTRYFVAQSASGQQNGQSWTDAFTDLHDALALAISGDEVWVATGTYFPSATDDRSARFQLSSGVRMYGGFSGAELTLEERQIDQNPSIISGDIGIAGDSLDNSYTLLYLYHPELGTEVDGFVFCQGQADHQSLPNFQPGTSGAALFVDGADNNAYPTLRNCVFEHNTARSNGGAVYIDGSGAGSVAAMFQNCRFYQNRSFLGSGGAVYRNGGSWMERPYDFWQCQFVENWAAKSGGGLYLNDSERSDTTQIIGCQFEGNRADVCSDAMTWGYARNSGSHLKILKSEFTGHLHSGTLMLDLLGPDLATSSFYAVIDSCEFGHNSIETSTSRVMIGGLRFFGESRWEVLNSIIHDNSGLIFFSEETNRGEPHFFQNVEFYGNSLGLLISFSSSFVGKNLSIHDNTSAVYFNYPITTPGLTYYFSFHLSNSEFFNNTMERGFSNFRGADSSSISSCTFASNSISYDPEVSKTYLFNNALSNNIHFDSGKKFPYFLFSGSDTLYIYNSSIDTIPLASPIHQYNSASLFSTNPLFRDTTNGDYSLLPCSPLINAGSNLAAAGILTDLAGNPRIQGGTVDIGAYESPAFALSATPQVQPACLGASNGSISLQPENGCAPLVYQWSPNVGSGPELDSLAPGLYVLTLTDGSGQQITNQFIVETAPSPALALVPTDVLCGAQAGGTLSASVQGGTAPFEYLWSPAAEDTPLLTQQQPGAYALTIVDANGCQDSATAAIALMGQITLTIGGQIIPCHGETGWLSATPSTGAAPFSWLWDGWPGTDPVAEPLGPGQYSVTVTDAYGCTATNTYPPMTEPGPLSVGTGSSDQTQNNPPNGAAVVTTISGGTGPFGYLWEPGGGTSQAIAGLVAGTYTVTVTDKNGCSISTEVIVQLMVSSTYPTPEGGVIIYPNPATDWLRVLLPAAQSSSSWYLELSDASGRMVRSQGCEAGDCVLDLSGLAGGAYVLTARSGERVFVGKVVVGM
jgi:predicted outer membrane repeat protein